MKTLEIETPEAKQQITLQSILFATDFEASARRALPFAVALADRYGARLYLAHVIPQEAYALARPESMERILREAQDYAGYALQQLAMPLGRRGALCETLLGEGDVAEVLSGFVQDVAADLVVMGTSSRSGLGKMLLGSIAEEVIRESTCPVLTVGPHVTADASAGLQQIVCAIDFSASSLRAAEYAVTLADEYQAHLTLTHVVEDMPQAPLPISAATERRLLDLVPRDRDLRYAPQVAVETGPVAQKILEVATDLSADMIVMGVRGAGAFAQTASHFGSIAHRVVSLAGCPVLTVGDGPQTGNE